MTIRQKIAGWLAPEMAAAVDSWGDFGWTGPGVQGSGKMSAEEAAKVSAVFACVTIIADAVGSVPLDIYLESEGVGGETKFRLDERLNLSPNPLYTAADFWQEMAFNAVLHGEAVAEPDTYGDLWPLPPSRTYKRVEERRIAYEYQELNGEKRTLAPADVFRFGGLSIGLEQVVPYEVAASAISFAKALETQGERFFSNSARLAGFLSTEKGLSDDAIKRIAKQFASFSGAVNAGKTPIFEQGMKYNQISASNQDSQFTELREHQMREIAIQWHIPLHLIGVTDAAKGTVEQQGMEFVRYVIRPWVRKIEQAIRRDLMNEEEREKWKVKFNLEGLLRGDSQTRAKNYVMWRTAGTASINECRKIEGLPKINEAWADDPREPLNSNRAADVISGGETSPQDREVSE